jgi:flagellar hook-length control protein FliK
MDTFTPAPLVQAAAPTASTTFASADAGAAGGRVDRSSRGSFAAELKNQQPDAPNQPAAPPQATQSASSPDASSQAADRDSDAAEDEDHKPASQAGGKSSGKNTGKAKVAAGADSPADGKALPPWLANPLPLPVVTASVAAPAAAQLAAATAAGNSQSAADAASVAAKAPAVDPATSAVAASSFADVKARTEHDHGPGAHLPNPAAAVAGAGQLQKLDGRLGTTLGSTAAAPTAPALASPPVPAAPVSASAAPAPTASTIATTQSSKADRSPAAVRERNAPPESLAADPKAAAPAVEGDLRRAIDAIATAAAKTDAASATTASKANADAAALLVQGATPTEKSTAPVVTQVNTPVGAPDWGQELRDRVAVLVDQNMTNAQIKLSPAHLGPIEIRIALSDGQANISFTTHSHVTREALEAAAPRLREVMASQGYSSVNVDVSQQQFRDRSPQPGGYQPEWSASSLEVTAPAAASGRLSPRLTPAAVLRLDAYA